jgi:hypothetical protein
MDFKTPIFANWVVDMKKKVGAEFTRIYLHFDRSSLRCATTLDTLPDISPKSLKLMSGLGQSENTHSGQSCL